MANADKQRNKEYEQAAKLDEHAFYIEEELCLFLADNEIARALLARVTVAHKENVDPQQEQCYVAQPEEIHHYSLKSVLDASQVESHHAGSQLYAADKEGCVEKESESDGDVNRFLITRLLLIYPRYSIDPVILIADYARVWIRVEAE